jgi:hypothetical protein
VNVLKLEKIQMPIFTFGIKSNNFYEKRKILFIYVRFLMTEEHVEHILLHFQQVLGLKHA